MIVHAQNEAPLVPDQSILQTPQEQAPLGILEGLRYLIPYQEGFIANLWQLGYISQKFSTFYSMVAFGVFGVLFFVLFRRRIKNSFQLWILFLFTLLAFGPIRLRMPFGVESLYGIVRFGGLAMGVFLIVRFRTLVLHFLSSSPLIPPFLLFTIALFASYPHAL